MNRLQKKAIEASRSLSVCLRMMMLTTLMALFFPMMSRGQDSYIYKTEEYKATLDDEMKNVILEFPTGEYVSSLLDYTTDGTISVLPEGGVKEPILKFSVQLMSIPDFHDYATVEFKPLDNGALVVDRSRSDYAKSLSNWTLTTGNTQTQISKLVNTDALHKSFLQWTAPKQYRGKSEDCV